MSVTFNRRVRGMLGAVVAAAAVTLFSVGTGGAPSGAVTPPAVTWVGVPCLTTGSEVVEGVTVSVSAYTGDGVAQCGTAFDDRAFYMGQAAPTGPWAATQTLTFAAPISTLQVQTLYVTDGVSETFTLVAKDSGGSPVGSPHVYYNIDTTEVLQFATPVASLEVNFVTTTGTAALIYFSLPEVPLTVTAESPAAVSAGTALPAIGYTSDPVTSATDWTTQPTCAVFGPADLTFSTPLTGVQPAGPYITRCEPGISAAFTDVTYVEGSIVVSPEPEPEPEPEPASPDPGSTSAPKFTG